VSENTIDTTYLVPLFDHARLTTANPAIERSQEELKMDGFNHAGEYIRRVVSGGATARSVESRGGAVV